MTDNAGEKKIIIDEDWKSQIEAEREAAESQQKDSNQPSTSEQPSTGPGKMPPASFEMLITTLATEAMVSLGQIPHPGTGEATANLDHAKYFIETLHVLGEKTKGNLTSDEESALEGLLHQLQLAFVAAQTQPPQATG